MSSVTDSPAAPASVPPSTNGAPKPEPETQPPPNQKTAEGPFAIRQLVRDYFIPVETNNIWYVLGGVLAITLILEVLTGLLLALEYTPDASQAFSTTSNFMASPVWSAILNFHFYASFLIFGLVLVHMMRVFISGGYRRGKQGLWTVGVLLAVATFVISLTGEALHWDEVGFGVPWNISEFLSAIGLSTNFNYTTDALLTIPVATQKLSQLYVVHIAIVPIALLLLIGMHYYLVRVKGISMPFWLRASGRTTRFTEHIRAWAIYSAIAVAALVLLSVVVHRDPGTAPQLLQSSPLFGSPDDPGGLGFTPTFPISWTRGMNIVVANMGMDPDIWGATIGMLLMFGALLVVPFIDRGKAEPVGWAAVFDLRKRALGFAAIFVFWAILIIGTIASAITTEG